jgi:hypothetical protein
VVPSAAQTQPASPAVLGLPPKLFMVRTSVCGETSCGYVIAPGCECGLGSPVRENRAPGSKWGDVYKKPCRLGDASVSKEAVLARLRKGYCLKACRYPPISQPKWLGRFLKHRMRDPRILRLIREWLKAGVLVVSEIRVNDIQGTLRRSPTDFMSTGSIAARAGQDVFSLPT